MKYISIINELCPLTSQYKILTNESLFGGFVIFGYFGMFYGLMILVFALKDEYRSKFQYINKYFQNSLNNCYIKYVFFILSFVPLILLWVVSGKGKVWFVMCFKLIIPVFLTMFFLYGLNIYWCIEYRGANRFIYEEYSPLEECDYLLMEDDIKKEKENVKERILDDYD